MFKRFRWPRRCLRNPAKKPTPRALEAAYLPSAHRLVEACRAHAEIGARLATLWINQGELEKAMSVIGEVFQAFANSPEPSLAAEQLLAEWRKAQS
jgi:hypothetical protein